MMIWDVSVSSSVLGAVQQSSVLCFVGWSVTVFADVEGVSLIFMEVKWADQSD